METADESDERRVEEDTAGGRRPSRRVWVVRGVLGLLLLACAVPAYFTATPGQCASCHEMEPYYDSWRTSSHRAAASDCLYCHVEPGILNLALYEIAFYGELVGHLTGAEVPATSPEAASARSCQRDACHSLNREVSYSGDLKINHRAHVVDAGVTCAECHPGAVHEGVEGRLKVPPMELCRECHEDEMEECAYCHAGKVLPEAPESH